MIMNSFICYYCFVADFSSVNKKLIMFTFSLTIVYMTKMCKINLHQLVHVCCRQQIFSSNNNNFVTDNLVTVNGINVYGLVLLWYWV